MGIFDRFYCKEGVSKYDGNPMYYALSQRDIAVIHQILCAAGIKPESNPDLLFMQLENIPFMLKLAITNPTQSEYPPLKIQNQLRQYEKDEREHIAQIDHLECVVRNNKETLKRQEAQHQEEIKKLKERIKFLEESKEKIYILKEFTQL